MLKLIAHDPKTLKKTPIKTYNQTQMKPVADVIHVCEYESV